jgi:HEAT repeat protein
VLWIGVGALGATAALFLFSAATRIALVRRLARERALAATWNPLFAECAERVPERLPALAARDAPGFLLLWCRAQESVRGESQARLVELARRAGADHLAHRLLRSRDERHQILSLIALGHLRDRAITELLVMLIPAAPSVISLVAAQALLRIDAERALPLLLHAAARREDWALARVVSMLKECDPAMVGDVLVVALRAELRVARPGPGLSRLLRLQSAAREETLRPAVLEALQDSDDPEVLAAALGALWHPQDLLHARRLAAHDDWVVRIAAAHALGRLGGRDEVPLLAGMLPDPNWWVRYRAAQALCGLRGVAAAEIEALRAGLKDRFALDILAQAMADQAAA